MSEMMNATLRQLERLLVGVNYVISLRLFRTSYHPDAPIDWYVTEVLGPRALVRNSVPATPREILADVEYSLRYEGDEGAGPRPAARLSVQFRQLLDGVLVELEHAVTDATVLGSFDLQEGRPGVYPVFWGFGYVIAGPSEALVFIGAASD